MIDQRLVELEQKRFAAMGFETVVTPLSVVVSRNLQEVVCGNDTYILTGIRVGDNDVVDDATRVTLVSPSASIQSTQRTLATMANSINQLFRHHIIIKTAGHDGWSVEKDCDRYALEFVKITPIKALKK